MRLLTFRDAPSFDAAVGAWLALDERGNNLMISVLGSVLRSKREFQAWLVALDGSPRLALMQTPPHQIIVAGSDLAAVAFAADSIEGNFPGVNGPANPATAFAERWAKRSAQTATLQISMTFYTADRIQPFPHPGGRLRPAAADEFEQLSTLSIAAARDMGLPMPEREPNAARESLNRNMAEGRQFVWCCDSEIRAMARYASSLPHAGARIGYVYTPPEFRGRGYGAAITGSLAQLLLDSGQQWVSLFADDANPRSTGIYRRLGFVPDHLFHSWSFEP